MLGADVIRGAGSLLLRAAVLRVLRLAVALLGPALLLPALLGALPLRGRAR